MAPHSSTLAWKIPWTEEPQAAVHGVAKSRTRLSDFTFTFNFYALEKEMATHSSVLAWRIPGMGSHRVGHDWSDLAVVVAAFYIRERCFFGGSDYRKSACNIGDWVQSIHGSPSWRREWLPTPVILPSKFQGQRRLAGYCPRSRKELDTTEWLRLSWKRSIQSPGFGKYYWRHKNWVKQGWKATETPANHSVLFFSASHIDQQSNWLKTWLISCHSQFTNRHIQ